MQNFFFFTSDFIHFKTVFFSDQDARYRCGGSIRRTRRIFWSLSQSRFLFGKMSKKSFTHPWLKSSNCCIFLHCLIFDFDFFIGSSRLSANNYHEAEKNIRNVTRDSLRQSYRTMVVRHPFERILSGYLWSIASDEGKILPTLPLDFKILKNF